MAESPKRPADVSRADASRVAKPAKGPTNETARAADSVPVAVGPFTVLPTQFGRYRIDKLLGKGAMGAVYLAFDTQLDRLVALKVARVSASGSAKLIQRMETEAKAAAKIDHPLICKVHDFGEIDGVRFIALQYIEGEDLKSYFTRVGRKREPAEALRLVLQMSRALVAAHAKGVIHRDLKPENVMLNQYGEPVIMDFGLARRLTGATNAGLTQGMILGTAAYMSPEQAIGKAEGIDHRSDLYALGVMLFEMLTGEWPFTGSAIEVMGKKSVQEAPSVLSLNPNIPAQLAAVCDKLIAKKKEDRYDDGTALVGELEAVDLNASVSLATEVEMSEASSPFAFQGEPSFDFLSGHSAAATSNLTTPIRRSHPQSPKRMTHALAPFMRWWRDQPSGFRWAIIGATTACLLFAMTIFFRSGDALVKIEVLADDVEVTFQNEILTLADGIHQFKVKPGDQTLHIKSGNVEFDTDKFTLKRGDNPAMTVEIVKSEIVTKLGDKEVGRRSLTANVSDESKVSPTIPIALDAIHAEREVGATTASDVVNRRIQVNGGRWLIEQETLVQSDPKGAHLLAIFGDSTWTDYDYSFKVEKTAGLGGVAAIFRAVDTKNCMIFDISGGNNDSYAAMCFIDGGRRWWQWGGRHSMMPTQTYTYLIKVRGSRVECFVDGVLRMTVAESPQHPVLGHGAVGVRCWGASARVHAITVVGVNGRTLWNGPPLIENDAKGTGPTTPPIGSAPKAFVQVKPPQQLRKTKRGQVPLHPPIMKQELPASSELCWSTRGTIATASFHREISANSAAMGLAIGGNGTTGSLVRARFAFTMTRKIGIVRPAFPSRSTKT